MKLVVFLLVLANMLLFASAEGYFGRPDNPDAVRVHRQMNPTQLQVVSRGAPPTAQEGEKKEAIATAAATAMPEKPAPAAAAKESAVATPSAEACLAWSELAAADADRLAVLLSEKFDDYKLTRQAVAKDADSWWVFIPPFSNKAEADKKAIELKKLGIGDVQIIQDNGPNRWAISLGVFSSDSGAKSRLAALKEKGVKSAKQGTRNGKESSYSIEARGPATRQQAVLDVTAAISSLKLEAKICK